MWLNVPKAEHAGNVSFYGLVGSSFDVEKLFSSKGNCVVFLIALAYRSTYTSYASDPIFHSF